MKSLHPDPPYEKPVPHPDNRFMALTSNCNDMPTLFVEPTRRSMFYMTLPAIEFAP